MVKSIFAKKTDAKQFLCFLMIKTLQLKGKVSGTTTKVSAARSVVVAAAAQSSLSLPLTDLYKKSEKKNLE